MATITATGVTPTNLTDYLNSLNALFQTALGTNLNLDPETPQGQIIGQLAFALSQYDEYVIDTVNSTSMSTAIGQQIDALAAALGIIRNAASSTEVDVQLTGVPGTYIPLGTKASDTQGNKFYLKENVTLGSNGQGAGIMVATVTGPVIVNAGTLNQIVDVVPGWETITNVQAGDTGQNQEKDLTFKNRYNASVAINSVTPTQAIRAALLAIPTVKQAIVPENFTSAPVTQDGVVLPPHSIAPVVIGGTDEEVGTAIGLKKTIGCDTSGTSTYTYTDPSSPVGKVINFYRATSVPIKISLSIRKFPNFLGNGVELIKENLVAYFNGTFQASPGFVTSGQLIGQDVIYTRMFTPINQIVGHEVVSLQIAKVGGSLSNADIPILLTEIATLDESDIDVQVVP